MDQSVPTPTATQDDDAYPGATMPKIVIFSIVGSLMMTMLL